MTVRREVFEPNEIPADLRRYFQEVEVPCGAPWLRVVERRAVLRSEDEGVRPRNRGGRDDGFTPMPNGVAGVDTTTLGWRQSCSCPAHQPSPSTVLDCFGGSGTTGIEANALGRHAVLVELQEKYVDISHKRLSGQPLSLFAHEGAAEFAGADPEAEEEAPPGAKPASHPNRTVAGFNERWKAAAG